MAINHVDELSGGWPDKSILRSFVDQSDAEAAAEQIGKILPSLFNATTAINAIKRHYQQGGFWRDLLALTGTLRTFHSSPTLCSHLPVILRRAQAVPSSISLCRGLVVLALLPNGISVVRAPFTFRTRYPNATCVAAVKLVQLATGALKIMTITTSVEELDCTKQKLPKQVEWKTHEGQSRLPPAVDCLIIGSGAGGLSVAAHLQSFAVNFAIVSREGSVGDSWKSAYKATKLHTVKRYSQLPFEPIPVDWPDFLSAELLAKYHQEYATKRQLLIFGSRDCTAAEWNARSQSWHIVIYGPHGREQVRARNIVYAAGIFSGTPKIPAFSTSDFCGQVLHSAHFTSAKDLGWANQKVAVIGSGTTAFDIALDAAQAGANVTMIQRGPVRLYPQSHIQAFQHATHNDVLPVEVADTIIQEDPVALAAPITSAALGMYRDAEDPTYYEKLRQAGLKFTSEGSIQQQTLVRGGSHYIDVGCCAAIANGQIKIVSDTDIVSCGGDRVHFKDGGSLAADVICLCTGYEKDVRKQLSSIIGSELAERLEPVWGLDEEGEVRGVWKQTSSNSHLWIQGGDLGLNRFFARIVALQVAAEVAGVRPPPYVMRAGQARIAETDVPSAEIPIVHL